MKRIASAIIIPLCFFALLTLSACNGASSHFILQNAEALGGIAMGALPVKFGGTWKLCRTDGTQIGSQSFASLEKFGENLLIFSRGKKFGLIDYQGKILFEISGVYLGPLYTGNQEFARNCLLFQTEEGARVYNYLTEYTSPVLPELLLPGDSPAATAFYARCPYEGLYLKRGSNRILSYESDFYTHKQVFFEGFSEDIHHIRSGGKLIRLKDAAETNLSDGDYEKVPYTENLNLQDIFYRYSSEANGSLSLKIRGDVTLDLSDAPENAPPVQFASQNYIVAGNMLYDLKFNAVRPLFLRYLEKIHSFGRIYLIDYNYRILYDTQFNIVFEHCIGSAEFLGETYILTKSGLMGNALQPVLTESGCVFAEAKEDVLAVTVFTTEGRHTNLYDRNFEKIAAHSSLNDFFYFDEKFYYFQTMQNGDRILKDRGGKAYLTCKNSLRKGNLVLGYDDASRLTSAIDLKSGVGLSPELMHFLRTNLQKEPDLYTSKDDLFLVLQFDRIDGCNLYSVKRQKFLFSDRFTSLVNFISDRKICLVLQGQSYISYSVSGSSAKKLDAIDTLTYTQSTALPNVFVENYSGQSVFFLADGKFSRPMRYTIEQTAGNFALIREGDRSGFVDGESNVRIPLRRLNVTAYPESPFLYVKEDGLYGTLYTDRLETLVNEMITEPELILHRGNIFLTAQTKSGKSFLLCAGTC